MYAVCAILKCPIADYARESLPSLVAVAGAGFFLSDLVLFLPNLIFGG